MADGTATPDRSALLARLEELGLSPTGARQLIDAEPIDAADDRRLLADLVGQLLTPSMDMSAGDALAATTEPGTTKVSNRVIAENFD